MFNRSKIDQNAAAVREAKRLLQAVYELEDILGIPRGQSLSSLTMPALRHRRDTLRAIASQRIDPNDNGEQHEPIYGREVGIGV